MTFMIFLNSQIVFFLIFMILVFLQLIFNIYSSAVNSKRQIIFFLKCKFSSKSYPPFKNRQHSLYNAFISRSKYISFWVKMRDIWHDFNVKLKWHNTYINFSLYIAIFISYYLSKLKSCMRIFNYYFLKKCSLLQLCIARN